MINAHATKRSPLTLWGGLFLSLSLACSSPAKDQPAIIAAKDVTPNPASVLPTGTPRVIAPGVIQPKGGEVEVAADGPGLLTEVLVKEGDSIKVGQILARFDTSVEEARVAAAHARVNAAEASVNLVKRGNRPQEKAESAASALAAVAKAQLSLDSYEREKLLFEKGATTQDSIDRAKRQAEADTAMADAASQRADLVKQGSRSEEKTLALADLDAANAQLKEAQAALQKREIRAPKDGIVLDVMFEAGEYYSPASGPLLLLGDMARSEALLEVDELDVPRVSIGQPVVITADGYTEPVARGSIIEIAPRMGQKTLVTGRADERADVRILQITVSIDNHALRSGLRVWGTINASPVPPTALNSPQ